MSRVLLVLLGTIVAACGITAVVSNTSGRSFSYNYFQTEHSYLFGSPTAISVLHEFTDFERLLSIEHYKEVMNNLARENETFYKYDEEFFEQKAIIMVELILSDSGIEYVLESVTRKESEITFNFISDNPSGMAGDVVRGTAVFIIEVYKNDIIDYSVNVNLNR